MLNDFPTIDEAEKLLPNAKKVADHLKLEYTEVPLYVGFISDKPISDKALQRGRELAEQYGW